MTTRKYNTKNVNIIQEHLAVNDISRSDVII